MIHNRTMVAISIGTVGGYLAGSMLPSIEGLVATLILGTLAIAITPRAETIAIQCRERQRLEEDSES